MISSALFVRRHLMRSLEFLELHPKCLPKVIALSLAIPDNVKVHGL